MAEGFVTNGKNIELAETGSAEIVTPDCRILISRFPKIGTSVAVYESDEEPTTVVFIKDKSA